MSRSISYQDIYDLLYTEGYFAWAEEPVYLLGCDIFKASQQDGLVLLSGTTIEATVEDPMELVGDINIDLWGFPFNVTLAPKAEKPINSGDQIRFVNDLGDSNYTRNYSFAKEWIVDDWYCDGMEKVWGKIHKSQHKEFWAATLIGDLNTMIDNFLHEYEGEVEKYDFIRGVHPLFVPALKSDFPKIANWGGGK